MNITFSADGVAHWSRTDGLDDYVLDGPLPGSVPISEAVSPEGATIVDQDVVYYHATDSARVEYGIARYVAGTLEVIEVTSPAGKIDWPTGRRIIRIIGQSARHHQQGIVDTFWNQLATQLTADFGELPADVYRSLDLGTMTGVTDAAQRGVRGFDFGELT